MYQQLYNTKHKGKKIIQIQNYNTQSLYIVNIMGANVCPCKPRFPSVHYMTPQRTRGTCMASWEYPFPTFLFWFTTLQHHFCQRPLAPKGSVICNAISLQKWTYIQVLPLPCLHQTPAGTKLVIEKALCATGITLQKNKQVTWLSPYTFHCSSLSPLLSHEWNREKMENSLRTSIDSPSEVWRNYKP